MKNIAAILDDPNYFPTGLTADLRYFQFSKVSGDRLRDLAFLDGRTPYTDGSDHRIDIDAVSRELAVRTPSVLRSLLHVSFCGSTLLSNMLDIPGYTQGIREPAIQIQLANLSEPFSAHHVSIITSTEQLLHRSHNQGVSIVKPTSWANNLLPIWMQMPSFNPVFIVKSASSFLTAVFRGGRERIIYTMRSAEHLSRNDDQAAELVRRAIGFNKEPLQQAARLSLVALSLHLSFFQAALAQWNGPHDIVLDHSDIRHDPVQSALRAAKLLCLDVPDDVIENHAGGIIRHNAKNKNLFFKREEEDRANGETQAQHGPLFRSALDWAARENLLLSIN